MECPLACCTKQRSLPKDYESCFACHDFANSMVSLNRTLWKKRTKIQEEIVRLKAAVLIAEETKKTLKIQKIGLENLIRHPKNVPLSESLLSLDLPKDFFSIVTREDLTLAFMIQSNFIPLKIPCKHCGSDMFIYYFTYASYVFHCSNCKCFKKIKNITFFKASLLTLEKILLFIFLWVLGLRDLEIANLLENSKSYISATTKKFRKAVGEEYLKDPPKFSGVVEIGISDFIKRKIEIGKSKAKNKWIIILAERETRQIYIEHIHEKTNAVVVAIIKKTCEPGTIIITKAWSVFGRLEDFGYCHYTFDGSQGFNNIANYHIHHASVKIAFNWLKYHIKTKNRSGRDLEEYILEWLWRKRNIPKGRQDLNQIFLFKAALKVFSKLNKYQA